ncbi:MAG: type 1 glutamine amidotransferase domain-containing protein [Muribaculaceae bacterium]|nr:type 1 glutamine amidotransferase domain-containing protein [Muribaculaceae bacterium]
MEKILFVASSHGKLGDSGRKTGYYLSEVTHPWSVLSKKYEIDVVSPKGGRPPVDGFELKDPINREYWDSPEWQEKMSTTLRPEEVDPNQYRAIFFAGGHGAMFDFPDNVALQKLASTIYENGGFVAAVCHGPAGLINVRLSDGSPLIKGKKFDCFTNEEEKENGTVPFMPYMLQSSLEEKGGIFEGSTPWSDHVVRDGRIITGQNPMSALDLGKTLLAALSE